MMCAWAPEVDVEVKADMEVKVDVKVKPEHVKAETVKPSLKRRRHE
jgi:hypothetical protein